VLVQPLIIAVLALWMLRARGEEIAIYVVVGSGMTGLWSSLLFISGNSINVERWSGTLETLVGVPTPLSLVVIGKNLANVLQSLSSMIVSYLLAGFLFGYSLRIDQPLLFAISLLFTILAFASFALIIAPVFVMNPGVQSFQNAMEFSGLYPVRLSVPHRPASGLVNPYQLHPAALLGRPRLHLTSSGVGSLQQVYLAWGMMLLFSAIYLLISSRLFKLMLDKARADATLDME